MPRIKNLIRDAPMITKMLRTREQGGAKYAALEKAVIAGLEILASEEYLEAEEERERWISDVQKEIAEEEGIPFEDAREMALDAALDDPWGCPSPSPNNEWAAEAKAWRRGERLYKCFGCEAEDCCCCSFSADGSKIAVESAIRAADMATSRAFEGTH